MPVQTRPHYDSEGNVDFGDFHPLMELRKAADMENGVMGTFRGAYFEFEISADAAQILCDHSMSLSAEQRMNFYTRIAMNRLIAQATFDAAEKLVNE